MGYKYSTNHPGYNALGSSISLALRQKLSISNLEYIQFHPTALSLPGEEGQFLLTEALRGEGAILRDQHGNSFAEKFHHNGEMAPRDILARAVYSMLQKEKEHNSFLDVTHLDSDHIKNRFPTIYQYLKQRNWDMTKRALPITPSAHYTCGGITTDEHGRTSLTNLFAAGEAANTGLHGGNRLASTSLLEGLVYGASVAHFVGTNKERNLEIAGIVNEKVKNDFTTKKKNIKKSNILYVEKSNQLLSTLKEIMWDHVGVIRTKLGLQHALLNIEKLREEADYLFEKSPCMETSALRDAVWAGRAVSQAALYNSVSKGSHFIDMHTTYNFLSH